MTNLLRFLPVALTGLVVAASCAVEAENPAESVAKRADAATALPTGTIILPPIKFCTLKCDDGNPCTTDGCNSDGTACVHNKRADGESCDDGDVCNGISTCQGGECTAGRRLLCLALFNPCVTTRCDPVKGCVSENNTEACEDGNPCTINDRCSEGSCKGGEAVSCDDNNPCTADSCDTTTGCVHTNVTANTACDDGNECTGAGGTDTCDGAGKCTGPGKVCEDPNPCTKNGCSNNSCDYSQLEPAGTACATANKCLLNTTCDESGQCTGGVLKDCNDGNPCTTDSCAEATGECVSTPLDSGDCSDGSECTTDDHCEAGVCQGEPVVCTPIDDCHQAGQCDAASGLCTDPRQPNGTECAFGGGSCKNGLCELKPVEGAAGASGTDPTAGASSTEGGAGSTGGGEGGSPAVVEGDAGENSTSPTSDAGATGVETPEGGQPGKGEDAAGKSSTNPKGGTGGASTRGEIFKREGGGCSTSPGNGSPSGLALLALLGAAVFVGRRTRTAREGRKSA